jgi:hypothetical protein
VSATVGMAMKPDDLPQSDTPDPADRDLSRRSAGPAISPWLVIGVILLLAALVYAASAIL